MKIALGPVSMDIFLVPSRQQCELVSKNHWSCGLLCSQRFYETIRDLMLAGFCFLLCVGCSADQLVTKPDHNSSVVKLEPADIFASLADSVGNTLSTTEDLSRIVLILKRNGELDDTAVATFDVAFPKAASESRALTADDATKLRGLK